MKKMLLISILSLISIVIAAQENLIVDGGFEKQEQAANNQIPRISAFADLGSLCQTQNPNIEPAVVVEKGKWYRKSPNSGYLKATVTSADYQDGEYSLLLSILKNSGQINLDKWYNNVLTQFVNVDTSKKYILTFYARANENCDKIYAGMVSGKGGSVKGSRWLDITDEWAEYTLEVHPSAHPDKGQFTKADMEKASVAIGIATQYDDNGKTKESSVFIDNIRLYEKK